MHTHTTVSATEVSLLLVLVCRTPCHHICDRTWTIRTFQEITDRTYVQAVDDPAGHCGYCFRACALEAYLLTYYGAMWQFIHQPIIYCVPKNDTLLTCYNFDVHQPILIIFGKNFYRENIQSNYGLFFHLTSVMLLRYLAKHGNTKIASFYLNVVLLLFQRLTNFNFVNLQLIFTLL